MVQAPVGIRCPRCVRYERNPLVHVRTGLLARGVGAGLVAATAIGAALGFLVPLIGFLGFFSLIVWGGAGYLIGQAVSLASNRSRARPMQWVAGGSALLAFTVAAVISPFLVQTLFGLFAAVIIVAVAVSSVR
jgi:hypothetical protein